jgi:hypothetical protein
MFTSSRRRTVLTSLTICLVLGLLLLPFALSAAPAYALRAEAAPNSQSGNQNDDVVILKEVQNPDDTTTVTVRIYAAPNAPNAPNTTASVSQDTYIASGNWFGNYGRSFEMGIGYSGSLGALRMLLQFNLSSIPSNATVNNATIHIFQHRVSGISNMGFQAQFASVPWNQDTATWDTARSIGGASLPIGNFPNTLGWLSANATNLFRTWVSGQEDNNGLIITGFEDPASNSSRWFYTSDYAAARPYADVTFTTGCSYTTPPTSTVNPLPATSPNAFTVSWTGTAFTPSGCAANGISSYRISYQVNFGDFIRWLDGTTATSATFNASSLGIPNGALVGFRSQALDNFGNRTPAGNATASTTINTVNPTVVMNSLEPWTTTPTFSVSWTGNTQGGPPITSYNFEVSVNGGGWQRLLSNTPQTSFQYSGANGSNYQFRAQASNNGGASFGPWSGSTSTTVDTAAPTTTMDPLPQYTTTTSFWVSWSGSDPGGSGVAVYNLEYQFRGGPWQPLISNTPQTSFYLQNAQTAVYAFRVQAVDVAGNVQPWPANAQASTTVLLDPLAVVQPFAPPVLQSTAPVTKSFNVSWKGYTPPGTWLTTITITYRIDSGSGFGSWQLWSAFPPDQTSDTFDWFDRGLPANASYQFRATVANNQNQTPFDPPSQYWPIMIVDMQNRYTLLYLPIIANNAP